MELKITKELADKEIKYILHSHLMLSRASVSRLKRLEDGILLDSIRVTVRAKAAEGQTLTLALEDRFEEENDAIEPLERAVEVLYEDDDCIVVNKPSGMPTHPSHGHHGDTLANALVARFKQQGTPFVFRPVNRLDRETSGAVLIAKNKAAAARLGAAMTRSEMEKTYLALLEGVGMPACGRIEGYVARAKESIIFREFRESGSESEYSLTEWKKLAEFNGHTLVEAHPITGRTHQLRVHFSHIGYPISGDGLYGRGEGVCHRLALHALKLTFPLNGNTVTAETAVPDFLKDIMP
ncbi:MAG: RluA family pseudouridine synthase [Clostridia bacterium]|nr:RluA family pseudouridine synthase [Clostridia bacterium]